MHRTTLVCFPYAGGLAAAFSKWKKYLDPSIDLLAFELAGRGKRQKEAFYDSFHDAVEDAFHHIAGVTERGPYAFFGHSMGSLLAFELAVKMEKAGRSSPIHLFLSGRGAPHIKTTRKRLHLLPDELLKKEVIKLGGVPRELLQAQEILDFFLPVIRADFKLVDSYCSDAEGVKLDSDMTILMGNEDDVSVEAAAAWKEYAGGRFNLYVYDGDHFFINRHMQPIIHMINQALCSQSISESACSGEQAF